MSIASTTLRGQDFKKPEIKGIIVDDECVKLLKIQSAKLEAAGAAKKLLAWAPLMLLAGETSAPHAAFSILSTNWDELATGIIDVDKLAFSVLATESLVHTNTHDGNPKLKEFWKAMSDFYASRIPSSMPSLAGVWKGSMAVANNNVSISIQFNKNGNKITGQFMVTSANQGPCDDLKITADNSISFSVGDGNQTMKFNGKVSSDGTRMDGTFNSNFGNGNWTAKKQ
jgi:hypothetical protein